MPRFRNAQECANFVANFCTVATTNLGTLTTLTAPMITALHALNTTLFADIAADINIKELAEASTQTVKTSKVTTNDSVDQLIKLVDAVPAVPPAILTALGLPQRDIIQTPVIPATPTNAVVVGDSHGDNTVVWIPGQAGQRVTFLVYGRFGTATEWTFIGPATRPKFVHHGQTPGVKATYAVKATRAGRESGMSNEATVYG